MYNDIIQYRNILKDFGIIDLEVYYLKKIKLNIISYELSQNLSNLYKEKENYILEYEGTYYKCSESSFDDYLYLYMEHGSPEPYSQEVILAEEKSLGINKNTKNEIIISKQSFFIFNLKENILYTNLRSDHHNTIKKLLKKYFEIEDILLTPNTVNMEEFLDSIKEVSSLEGELVDLDLFHNQIFAKDDVFGKEDVQNKLFIKFIRKGLKNRIKEWLNINDDSFKSLKLIATDENNVNKVFNKNIIYQSISFHVDTKEGMFDKIDFINRFTKEVEKV